MILVWAIVLTSCFFTLINRGQPLYAVSTGTSQGNLGGGAVNLPNLKAGEPLVATAGAERGVHVLNADRWSVVKRWPAAIKFEVSFFQRLHGRLV